MKTTSLPHRCRVKAAYILWRRVVEKLKTTSLPHRYRVKVAYILWRRVAEELETTSLSHRYRVKAAYILCLYNKFRRCIQINMIMLKLDKEMVT